MITKVSLTLAQDIFALVTYNRHLDAYRLWVWSEEAVPLFWPPLPCPPIFNEPQHFRDFLLVKRKQTLGADIRIRAARLDINSTPDILLKYLNKNNYFESRVI